jgi:2-oxoisovalerate dehydrogenase E1 component alpha subunit
MRGEDDVTVAYMDEGATSQGDFHEGLNFAAIHKLPVIYFCENNGYAITESAEKEMPIKNVADRAALRVGITWTADVTAVDHAHGRRRPPRAGRAVLITAGAPFELDDDRRYRTASC